MTLKDIYAKLDNCWDGLEMLAADASEQRWQQNFHTTPVTLNGTPNPEIKGNLGVRFPMEAVRFEWKDGTGAEWYESVLNAKQRSKGFEPRHFRIKEVPEPQVGQMEVDEEGITKTVPNPVVDQSHSPILIDDDMNIVAFNVSVEETGDLSDPSVMDREDSRPYQKPIENLLQPLRKQMGQ